MSRGAGPEGRLHSEKAGIWSLQGREKHLKTAREFLEPLSAEALLELPGTSKVSGTQAGRGATWEIKDDAGHRLFVKVLRKGGMAAKVRGEFHGRARLKTEIRTLTTALRRGVPTARLAFGASGAREDGKVITLLATEILEGTRSLAELLGEEDLSPEMKFKRRPEFVKAGAAVRLAHDAGLNHNDLNTGNILIPIEDFKMPPLPEKSGWLNGSDEPKPRPPAYVIDLGDSEIEESLSHAKRASNLFRLLRSVEKHFGTSAGRTREVAAFFRGYVSCGSTMKVDREFRRKLLQATRRRLPAMMIHRIGWS
jgi:tRNA A-37 threonylcarbamoyl transferase component Bud32